LIPYIYDLFKEKKCSPLRKTDLKFINTKIKKRQKHHKIKKNAFSKISCADPKLHEASSTLKIAGP
jgi:hypothetical protein